MYSILTPLPRVSFVLPPFRSGAAKLLELLSVLLSTLEAEKKVRSLLRHSKTDAPNRY